MAGRCNASQDAQDATPTDQTQGPFLLMRPEAEGKGGTLGWRPDAAEMQGRKKDVRTRDKAGEKSRRCEVAAGCEECPTSRQDAVCVGNGVRTLGTKMTEKRHRMRRDAEPAPQTPD